MYPIFLTQPSTNGHLTGSRARLEQIWVCIWNLVLGDRRHEKVQTEREDVSDLFIKSISDSPMEGTLWETGSTATVSVQEDGWVRLGRDHKGIRVLKEAWGICCCEVWSGREKRAKHGPEWKGEMDRLWPCPSSQQWDLVQSFYPFSSCLISKETVGLEDMWHSCELFHLSLHFWPEENSMADHVLNLQLPTQEFLQLKYNLWWFIVSTW